MLARVRRPCVCVCVCTRSDALSIVLSDVRFKRRTAGWLPVSRSVGLKFSWKRMTATNSRQCAGSAGNIWHRRSAQLNQVRLWRGKKNISLFSFCFIQTGVSCSTLLAKGTHVTSLSGSTEMTYTDRLEKRLETKKNKKTKTKSLKQSEIDCEVLMHKFNIKWENSDSDLSLFHLVSGAAARLFSPLCSGTFWKLVQVSEVKEQRSRLETHSVARHWLSDFLHHMRTGSTTMYLAVKSGSAFTALYHLAGKQWCGTEGYDPPEGKAKATSSTKMFE